jgi:hypothetical protein
VKVSAHHIIVFAVVLNSLRTLTTKIGIDESGRPRQLDYLLLIDPQQQGDCKTRPCWPGSSSSPTSSTSRSHANSPSDGPSHQGYIGKTIVPPKHASGMRIPITWDGEADQLLIEFVERYGRRWKLIFQQLRISQEVNVRTDGCFGESETSEILANYPPGDLRSHVIILRLAHKSGVVFRRLFVTHRKRGSNKL